MTAPILKKIAPGRCDLYLTSTQEACAAKRDYENPSVGKLEELERGPEQFYLVTGYYPLAKFPGISPLSGLELSAVSTYETHAITSIPAFAHGLRAFVWGRFRTGRTS